MTVPENYTLEKKEIKHARIRVSEDGHVRVLVPHNFSDEDVESLLLKKARWIAKQQSFFANKLKIELGRNQLLMFGNRYNYFYDEKLHHRIIIDHEFKTIRAKRDLLDMEI